jgi:hypothetical protein
MNDIMARINSEFIHLSPTLHFTRPLGYSSSSSLSLVFSVSQQPKNQPDVDGSIALVLASLTSSNVRVITVMCKMKIIMIYCRITMEACLCSIWISEYRNLLTRYRAASSIRAVRERTHKPLISRGKGQVTQLRTRALSMARSGSPGNSAPSLRI